MGKYANLSNNYLDQKITNARVLEAGSATVAGAGIGSVFIEGFIVAAIVIMVLGVAGVAGLEKVYTNLTEEKEMRLKLGKYGK